MTNRTLTGVLGGTFDPIHQGHLDVANAARQILGLDKIFLVPSCIPPHRSSKPKVSAHHRSTMVALAVLNDQHLRVSDLELKTAGPSYTSLTIDQLHQAGYDRFELFFIVGGDAFLEIASWKGYPKILEQCHFVVISRPGHQLNEITTRFSELSDKIRWVNSESNLSGTHEIVPQKASIETTSIFIIETPTTDVSSTEIRRRLATGKSISGLVPNEVAAYIHRHGLYLERPTVQG